MSAGSARSGEKDPVLVQRAKVADLVSKGIRLGTALYVVASVVFFVCFMTGFAPWIAWTVTGLMIVGSLLLAPALVLTLCGGVAAEQVISGKKAERGTARVMNVLDWHESLETAQSLAAENQKLVFWLQLVGDLPGGL